MSWCFKRAPIIVAWTSQKLLWVVASKLGHRGVDAPCDNPHKSWACPTKLVIGLAHVLASLVYRSRNLGEWSFMIGYKMGSSSVMVYTMTKTSPVENFKHRWKNEMDANMATIVLLGEPLGKKT